MRKQRERWVAIINPASLPRVRLNRAYAEVLLRRTELLAGIGVSMVVGMLWIRKIVNADY